MAHLLDSPRAYIAFQRLVGAEPARRACVREYARRFEGMRVLDVGCGPGYMATSFPGAQYVGLDVNPRYVRHANTRYRRQGLFRCAEISESNVHEYSGFDLVLLYGVLHHLDDREAVRLLALLSRCLNRTGRLMTLDGCRHPGASRIERLLLRLDRGQHVRDEQEYLKLARSVFPAVTSHRRDALLRLPYRLLVLVCGNG